MTVGIQIQDGEGTRVKAGVTPVQALKVNIVRTRAQDIDSNVLTGLTIYHEYLKNSAGSSNMDVNGSLAKPIVFFKNAEVGKTFYITHFRLIFNSTNMNTATAGELQRFGPVAAPGLTNGILLTITQNGNITNYFLDPIQSIIDFFNYSDSYVNFQDGISAGVDFLSFEFVLETPLILTEGSFDNISIYIRDNITAIALFRAILHGYYEVKQ
jgi:hypothetical protein